jgi:amino acid adenylation domain-containing protein
MAARDGGTRRHQPNRESTLNTLKNRVQELSPEKLKALTALLAARKAGRTAAITRDDPKRTTFPLSFSQERLWFFEQLFPGTAVYNWPFAWPLDFAIPDDAARRMLNELVERHEILRTTYRLVDNVPMQCVAPPAPAYVLFHDFSASADPFAEVQASLVKYGHIAFDMAHGPLCKFYFFRTGENSTVMGGVMHHSVVDAGSRQALIEEMSRLLSTPQDAPAAVAPLPLQYGDFAAWQRENFSPDRRSPALDYWVTKLAELPRSNVPTDHPRTDQASFASGIEQLDFPPALADALRRFSRQHGVTLFTVLLAGFLVQLGRYSGERDLATAIPVAGRNRKEVESLIGFFVNTLVIREQLDDALSFEQFVMRVKATVLDALSNQDVPFERLVEALSPTRELSRNPLCDFMFQLENVQRNVSRTLREIRIAPESTAFDFDIHLYEEQDGDAGAEPPRLFGSLTYSQDLFDTRTVRGFADAYMAWLEAAVATPAAPMRTLAALSRDDLARLDAWNDTFAAFSSEPSLLEALEALAVSRPDAVALECDGARLTYEQLDDQSERIAQALRRRGVRRGSFVAVCVRRSTRMVAMLVGIMKSGAAYIPLSPSFPEERLRAALDDAAPALVVVERWANPGLFDGARASLCIAEDWNSIQDTDISRGRLRAEAGGADLAYRIYTSGSTGKPKGVDVRRDALDNIIHSVGAHCDIDSSDVWLGVTSISFDIAALEIFLPLSIGACCVLATEGDVADPERLQRLIVDSDVSVMQATPATWQILVLADFQAGRRQLKVITGGEALPAPLASQLLSRSDQVWNVYGPTETTIWSSIHRLGDEDGEVPIGKPLANTSFYVLDEQLNRVPIGALGGLFIGGAGLANGYAGQPALTAAQFVPDPYSATPGARMYRTGDRVKFRHDGALVYLGRADNQTKIRGFRVELDEIEACMLRHPDIAQAAVKAWPAANGSNQLSAYFTLRDPQQPVSAEAMRAHVSRSLPAYMVPGTFMELEHWPLTANGKLDRRALPAALPGADNGADHEAAATPTEIALARVWKKTLANARIGRHDSFFELGGNSLASVQMAYLAKEEGITLRASDVFQAQTLSQLAASIDRAAQRQAEEGTSGVLGNTFVVLNAPADPGAIKDALFLVHPAGGDVMCYHALAAAASPTQPIIGLAYSAFPRSSDDAVTVERLAAWYIAEIRREFGVDPRHVGGWSFGGTVAFEMARQLRATDLDVASVLIIDQPAPGVDVVVDRPTSAMADIVRRLELFFGRSIDLDSIDMDATPGNDLLDTILRRMKSNDMFPGHLSPTAFRDFLSAYDIHMHASDAYQPGRYDGALTLLRATDPSPPGIFSSSEHPDRTLGWQDFCELPVRVRSVPGHHLTVVAAPHAHAIAEEIGGALST